ncbi:MAG: GNAT family N-acetyltransferase/peptidase C39 family protein [Gammaproteobacteria bacterium]|nr:GNAT family N-acetyltransferase/peptidase C39 family protein [Gammaproteobacteria bacterium]
MNVSCREAVLADLAGLVELERACFDSDRISRRQLRHLLSRANAVVLLAERDGKLLGDVVMLFNRATSTARIYSIAVSPEARGQGVARRLVEAAEEAAWERQRAWVRLEVRKDNVASIGLFEGLGYHRFGEHRHYYEDHADAWRYEKTLHPSNGIERLPIAYYRQSLDFTCGPAALMMAMHALDPDVEPSRRLELRLWREATTIFMTSGHGGCGPYGLGLAAARRGFRVEIFVSDQGVHFVETVRDPEKKHVIGLVQEDMQEQLEQLGVAIHSEELSPAQLRTRFQAGAIPLALLSSWQIYEAKVPHWVVISGFDDHFVYVTDPFVDSEKGETELDSINMPIANDMFSRIARYGRRALRAVVLISREK